MQPLRGDDRGFSQSLDGILGQLVIESVRGQVVVFTERGFASRFSFALANFRLSAGTRFKRRFPDLSVRLRSVTRSLDLRVEPLFAPYFQPWFSATRLRDVNFDRCDNELAFLPTFSADYRPANLLQYVDPIGRARNACSDFRFTLM